MRLYHTSRYPVRQLENTPLFCAVSYEHAVDGWYANARAEGNKPAIYELKCKPNCNIVDITEPINFNALNSLADDNCIRLSDYLTMLLENPSSEDILNNEFTKVMIANGIDGLIYYDYDPRDFSKDLEAAIVFRPLTISKSWTRVK